MIDAGQAVDVKGITERSLVKHLKKLFIALSLEENGGVFLLPSDSRPVLEVVGPLIHAHIESKERSMKHPETVKDLQMGAADTSCQPTIGDDVVASQASGADTSARRRYFHFPKQ